MLSAKQLRESILILVSVALAPGSAAAQPLAHTFWTIEAKTAQADHVVVGTIAKVSRKTIVAPGGPDKIGVTYPDGQFEYTVTLKVGEVLKGNLMGTVDDLRPVHGVGTDERYEEWSKARTTMLWFLGPTPKADERRSWDVVLLGKPLPAEAIFYWRSAPPMFSQDFTVLKEDEEVLARARAYAKTSTKVLPTHAIRIPPAVSRQIGPAGPLDDLIVPVDPSLEQRARRLIASPQDFVPKGEKLHSFDRYQLRFGGVNSLRYFQSDANAALLRSLLDDPQEAEPLEALEIRTKAYEILLHWGADLPLPKSADEMTVLDLSGTGVTDAGLKQLAKLKNLAELDLRDTKVTHEGLKQLAPLKKLTLLDLSEGQMSDANLRALREIGLLHTVSPATTKGDYRRPQSVEEVHALTLCRGPLTDAGLKELAGFKNLTWLDLRDTQVTDAGLEDLAALTNLTRVLLQNTRVTKAGITKLRKALPYCKIDY